MRKFCVSAALLLCLALAPGAAATVIDFNALTQPGIFANCVGTSYSTGGFTFTDTNKISGVCVWQTGSPRYTGETMLFENTPDGILSMTKDGSGTFSVQSIDLATVFNDNGPSPVHFVGTLFGGGTVTADALLNSSGIHNFVFPNTFVNLVSLNWQQSPNYNQFTNIVVNSGAVPEPATLALLGVGLLFVGRKLRK